jgi:DNA modification methylase
MTHDIETGVVHTGDVYDVLPELPESSVHMCMTSPPYFGLRDYGEEDQIGLEESLDDYIENLVRVGDELRRVLRPDGSWWLNLGDSYAGDKNKMLVPHRVAIALQDTGWTVRNDVTWVKPNPMPSSVKDRLNTTTEQVFHLTPEPDYWYDLDAIREPHAERSIERMDEGPVNADTEGRGTNDDLNPDQLCDPAGKNPGDVFEVTTKPFADAHFAVYPPELVEKPLKATCPPTVCAACGSPYEREVERETIEDAGRSDDSQYVESGTREEKDAHRQLGGNYQKELENRDVEMKGWQQTCDCDTDATEPGIALDPFAGAGTTLLKAKELQRRFVGIELNAEYADMARERIGLSLADPSNALDDEAQTSLFDP